MKATESDFIPASKLPDLRHERLLWRATLPDYAPAENILINVNRLNRLAWLGGVEVLFIDSYIGETTTVSTGIDSVNQHGVATANLKGHVSVAKTQEIVSLNQDDPRLPYESRWSIGTVKLNVPEIDETVSREGKLRDSEVWAKQLDKALKEGVKELAWKSLVTDATRKYMPLFAIALNAGYNAALSLKWGYGETDLIVGTVVGYPVISNMLSAMHNAYYGLEPYNNPRKKLSLIPNPAIDRYLTVSALTRVLTLAKGKQANK